MLGGHGIRFWLTNLFHVIFGISVPRSCGCFIAELQLEKCGILLYQVPPLSGYSSDGYGVRAEVDLKPLVCSSFSRSTTPGSAADIDTKSIKIAMKVVLRSICTKRHSHMIHYPDVCNCFVRVQFLIDIRWRMLQCLLKTLVVKSHTSK